MLGPDNPYSGFVMLGMMVFIVIFMVVLPQRKRKKELQALHDSVVVGDKIITIGGLHGKVASIDGEVFSLEVATGVKITMSKDAIATVIKP